MTGQVLHVDRIYLAGEIEFGLAERNATEGVPLLPTTVKELKELGARFGVAWPFGQ